MWIQPAFASSAAGIVFPLPSVALQTLPASPLIPVTTSFSFNASETVFTTLETDPQLFFPFALSFFPLITQTTNWCALPRARSI